MADRQLISKRLWWSDVPSSDCVQYSRWSCTGGRRHGRSGLSAVLQKHPGWFHSRDALTTWNTPHFPLKRRHAACNPITIQFVISQAFKHVILTAWNAPTLDSQVIYCITQLNLVPQITKPNTNARQMQMNGVERVMIKMLFQEVPSKKSKLYAKSGGCIFLLPWSTEMYHCTFQRSV